MVLWILLLSSCFDRHVANCAVNFNLNRICKLRIVTIKKGKTYFSTRLGYSEMQMRINLVIRLTSTLLTTGC